VGTLSEEHVKIQPPLTRGAVGKAKGEVVEFGWELLDSYRSYLEGLKEDSELPFDCIVGVLRGGAIPAIMMSNILELPIYWVSATSYHDRVQRDFDWLNFSAHKFNVENKRVVVVDDIVDKGTTMTHLTTYLKIMQVASVQGFALVSKGVHLKECDVYTIEAVPPKCWVVFPWEK